MGWADAPVVEDGPSASQPSWMDAPEVQDDQPDYGLRQDGTRKGNGYYGPLPSKDPRFPKGTISTELSADTDVDGKNLSFPLLVPGLSRKEIDSLLSGERPSDAIYDKAIGHAQQRIANGQSPFAGPEDQQIPVPNYEEPSMGAVALNAVPKVLANLANTPHTLNGLVIRGLASLPGLDKLPEVKNFLQGIADNPEFNKNHPMEFMRKIGAVNPENEPQTGPQRIVDTAIQAAVGSAAIPAGGILNTAKSAAMGATSGAAAGVTKEASRETLGGTGSDLLAGVVGMATPFAAKGISNAVTQSSKKLNVNPTEKQTLQAGQQYGLVVEPSAARGPASIKESLAGKAALAQESSLANQPKFNEMANRYIGLPPDAPLTTKVFDSYKKTIAKPFEEVDQVFNQMKQSGQLPYFPRYHSQSLMDEYREAGDHARALWRAYSTAPTKDINMLKAAKAADAATDSVFKDITMVANAAGNPQLVTRLNNARKLYARISDVQAATTVGSGNVDALAVGRMMQEGKPFEGELRDMAHFANTFPRSSRPKESIPPPGVSGGDMAMGPVIAAGTGDVKSGLLAFGIPGLRQKMRRDVLSEAYQRGLLKEPAPIRKKMEIPKSAARNSSLMTGKTVLDNAEASE